MPKNNTSVLRWRPKNPYHCTPRASKGVFGCLGWGCLNYTMPKKEIVFDMAPKTPIPLYPIGQHRCFWIPEMGVFELHNAKKYSLDPGVATQTPLPLYPIGQQRCFWIPMMGVFELHNADKYCLGFGVAHQNPIPLFPIGQQRCFWIPGMGVLERHKATK